MCLKVVYPNVTESPITVGYQVKSYHDKSIPPSRNGYFSPIQGTSKPQITGVWMDCREYDPLYGTPELRPYLSIVYDNDFRGWHVFHKKSDAIRLHEQMGGNFLVSHYVVVKVACSGIRATGECNLTNSGPERVSVFERIKILRQIKIKRERRKQYNGE